MNNANIHYLNLKNTDVDPFTIVESGDEITYIAAAIHDDPNNNSPFDQWNHYPINVHHSFGELAFNNDEASHSPTGNVYAWPDYETGTNFASKVLLTGMDDLSDTELTQLARSWDTSAALSNLSGITSQGYSKAERAYQMIASSESISFTINANANNPVYNPAFVVKNWNCDDLVLVKLNGNMQTEGVDYKLGNMIDTNGTKTLIIWLEEVSESNLEIEMMCTTTNTEETDIYLAENSLELRPVPFDNYLIIEGELSDYAIEILDVQGNLIQTIETSSNKVTVDTQTFPNGTYFVKIMNMSNQLLQIEKIIKLN